MARPKAKAPALRYHISGQSVVTIGGRDIYLGPHNSAESIARYAVLIGDYQSGGLTLPEDFDVATLAERAAMLQDKAVATAPRQADQPILVKHITALFRDHARAKYVNAPVEQKRHERLCDKLDGKFGDCTAEQFGPVKLKTFRDDLVAEGLARKYVNRLVNCVIAIFKHAVSGELIDIAKVQQLKTLEPLRNGQTAAPETPEVEPANIAHVRATAKHLTPVVKAMLRIQIATGMRPGELFNMRPCDIDRRSEVWLYRPSRHKTSWRGKKKVIPLVGDARDAVTDYLFRDPEAFCFSPAESVAWVRAVASANRKTPLSCGNKPGSNRQADPKRTPKSQYTATSYCQSIQRAAKRAGVPQWHPYQCRHLTATVVRAALGIEDTKALLGHSTAAMTAHYARESIEAATRAANAAPKL